MGHVGVASPEKGEKKTLVRFANVFLQGSLPSQLKPRAPRFLLRDFTFGAWNRILNILESK
jgi:hypothetical protein